MARILIQFPEDRSRPGQVTLRGDDGRILAGPFPAYGRADSNAARQHGNPQRDPTQPFGDTPYGGYRLVTIVQTGQGTPYNERSYGPSGAIVIQPTSGDALAAARNGREGLMIHAGAPGPNGSLRATHGCVRVSNADMAQLVHAVNGALRGGQEVGVRAARVNVSVVAPVHPVTHDRPHDPPPGVPNLIRVHPPVPPTPPGPVPPTPPGPVGLRPRPSLQAARRRIPRPTPPTTD